MTTRCGCGETTGLTTVAMTDRLWAEFFAVPGATRPATATACRVCIVDWQRYAAPLVKVCTRRSGYSYSRRSP